MLFGTPARMTMDAFSAESKKRCMVIQLSHRILSVTPNAARARLGRGDAGCGLGRDEAEWCPQKPGDGATDQVHQGQMRGAVVGIEQPPPGHSRCRTILVRASCP